MSVIKTAKTIIRKELKAKLSALASVEKKRQFSKVTSLFLAHPYYLSCMRISIYLSLPDEVYTLGILRHALVQGKECFIPRRE